MPQLALGRLSFGRSNILPAVLNWGMMIGWTAFDTFFGATAFHLLTGGPFWLGALLTILLMMIIVRVGYEAIMMYQKYMAMALSVVFIIIAVKVVMIGDFSRPDAVAGTERVAAFILMTTLSASFAMSWSVFGSDYTRYLPKETPSWKVFAYAAGGLAVACSWLQVLGLAVASIVVGSSVGTLQNDVLGGGLLGGIALVAIFFGIISVDALNTYTGSLSFLTIGIRLTRTQSVLLAAVVAFAATLWLESQNFAETFSNYLLIISYWIAPFAGVVVADWLLRRRRADVSGIQSIQRLPFGTKALVSFVVGALASVPFMSATLYVGPLAKAMHYTDIANYVGLVVAAVVYAVLTRWATSKPTD
jgi:NCS1 family nucleobase:cation symporter-1